MAISFADLRFHLALKNKLFTNEITIQPADETDNILSNPVFTQVLQDRIAEYEAKKQVISLKTPLPGESRRCS